jgi:hypothetical protein
LPRKKSSAIVPVERVRQVILLLRGQRVIIDAELARLYGVTTIRLNQQVQRNIDRFPEDFMFQLTWEEAESLSMQIASLNVHADLTDPRSQIVTLNPQGNTQVSDNKEVTSDSLRSQFAILNDPDANLMAQTAPSRRGKHLKYRPFAFTEHGAIMAATVLKSPQAVQASLFVVRAFVQLRDLLSTHRTLAEKLNELERKLQDHDGQILGIIDAIRELMNEPDEPAKPPIGYHTEIARIAPSSRKKG